MTRTILLGEQKRSIHLYGSMESPRTQGRGIDKVVYNITRNVITLKRVNDNEFKAIVNGPPVSETQHPTVDLDSDGDIENLLTLEVDAERTFILDSIGIVNEPPEPSPGTEYSFKVSSRELLNSLRSQLKNVTGFLFTASFTISRIDDTLHVEESELLDFFRIDLKDAFQKCLDTILEHVDTSARSPQSVIDSILNQKLTFMSREVKPQLRKGELLGSRKLKVTVHFLINK